jgi:uncharacterized protein
MRKLRPWNKWWPRFLANNKLDAGGAPENFEILRDLYGARFALTRVSAETREGLEPLRQAVFALLEVIRVYTETPGNKLVRTAPYILKRGSHLGNLAAESIRISWPSSNMLYCGERDDSRAGW